MRRSSVPVRATLIALLSVVAITGARFDETAAETAAAPPGEQQGDGLEKVDDKVLDVVESGRRTTFWVRFAEEADLSGAAAIEDWAERGAYVVDQLRAVAAESQAAVRAELDAAGTPYTSYWVSNAVRVTGDEAVVKELADEPAVTEILAPTVYRLPDPIAGVDENSVSAVEWGIARINADDVWSQLGVRGEGIVVANIDTGVQFDHPALVEQYRGNLGGGTFDHNYNWWDPSRVCGNPSVRPCDNHGHGTHTMGTMVGDDGAGNQIGVAPKARWIGVKGCETASCSDAALLSSAQFVLAPTDLTGANPRPDLRPHVVNNSWGGGGGDQWYRDMVRAWSASGIFPQFSNGNSGPGCGLAGSPGDYPESYSAGAFDANGVIASFSSRGASRLGGIKPNIAAPGVNVRSSVPGGGYANFHGTSMASPHVAGTVALMWSAAPAHIGSLVTTMTALDVTAHDVEDLQCGGTAADNNVWGEGMLDALAGVEMVQSAAPATVAGTVTDANTGVPLADVAIEVQGEGFELSASTATDGTYTFVGLAGDYTLSLSAFGYEPATATTTASGGQTTVLDVAMVLRPVHSVAGTVTLAGEPVAGTLVRLLDVPLPTATTDADGRYQIDGVPADDYRLQMDARPPLGNCVEPNLADRTIGVDADETVDFELVERTDAAGYGCEVVAPIDVEGTDSTGLVGDDKAVEVPLPFPFPFYGTSHERAFISTNGVLTFEAASEAFNNGPIPSTGTPNAAVYVLWDDHVVLDGSPVLTATVGTAPNRGFVIEWRDLRPFLATGRIDVEAVLYEDGSILMQYHEVAGGEHVDGGRATVGLENGDGTVGFQYSFNERMRFGPDFAVLFEPDRPPVVDLVTPGNGASYRLGDVVNADYVCADDRDPTPSCEGTVPDGSPIDTSSAGAHTFEVTATDSRGQASSAAVEYLVVSECNGLSPTLIGGPDDDVLEGTSGDDVILDPWGDNTVRSGSGNDTICVGSGHDVVDSGADDDWVEAGGGDNRIVTGNGDDTVTAGSGADDIGTGNGIDAVDAGDGGNRVLSGNGDDTVTSGVGDDLIDGGTGRDLCSPGTGTNQIIHCEL